MGNDKIFALDIGTRSVVGIILTKHEQKYEIIDMVIKEHEERSMLDGQIHDVLSVSKVIAEIKDQLEKTHGTLRKVCVAAAGRALKTERASSSLNIIGKPMMQKEDVLHLELSAVQQAQFSLAQKHDSEKSFNYYCVGYSVLHYKIDDDEIGSLIDQQGKTASAEIIATFLPKMVVESLLAALARAGLEMDALTLEPIAAINVLIPSTMRRLNIALVDIGAGTSDIAITDEGTIISYGMVPIAGDEITEAISDEFLLDFPLAESAKRDLQHKDSILLTDILGFETEIPKEEVIERVSASIDRLSTTISDEILKLNNEKAPKAVMLVGGGSLTPNLPKLIAEKLGLPENRVAIRGSDAIQNLSLASHIPKGPEFVTPVGIALAANQNPIQYINVTVNDSSVRLFDMKKLTAGDAILAAGIDLNKMHGKPGLALIVSLNGAALTLPGHHGHPPVLLVNGEAASLDDDIKEQDSILITKGLDGSSPQLRIADILDDIPEKRVTINGRPYIAKGKVLRNGAPADINEPVQDRDELSFEFPQTIQSLLETLNLKSLLAMREDFLVTINSREFRIHKHSGKVLRNGLEAKLASRFEDGDEILISKAEPASLKDVADAHGFILEEAMPVRFNGETVYLKKTVTEVYRGEKLLSPDDLIHNGDSLKLAAKNIEPFIFQDLFRFVELQIPGNLAGRFVLMRNGKEAAFHEKLAPGDELSIDWPEAAKI